MPPEKERRLHTVCDGLSPDLRMSKPSQKPGYTLLTGATGLVGSILLRDLLLRGKHTAVLVRPTCLRTAAERIESNLQYWESQFGRQIARPVCLSGDVSAVSLGLDTADKQWLYQRCARVVHCAAVVKFATVGDPSNLWQTNFGGTRRVLELCRKLGVRDFHYVSTAYVCGTRQGLIRESELEEGQSFRNDYERSKFETEKLVRADDFIFPATIYRPAVIGGDSQTGYTNSYHGLYSYLRLLHVLMTNAQPGPDGRRYAPLRIALDGNECRNVVPVDWVSAVICRLLDVPAAHGQTYHLAPRVPLTTRKFFEATYDYFKADGFEFCGRNNELTGATTVFEDAFLTHRAPYVDYELTDPRFDSANLDRFVHDLPCPEIDDNVIHRYLRFGERDMWGKRPLPRPTSRMAARPIKVA